MLVACRSNPVLVKVVLKLCKVDHESYRIIQMHIISIKTKIHICILSFCM